MSSYVGLDQTGLVHTSLNNLFFSNVLNDNKLFFKIQKHVRYVCILID